jgi:hypothetical protein
MFPSQGHSIPLIAGRARPIFGCAAPCSFAQARTVAARAQHLRSFNALAVMAGGDGAAWSPVRGSFPIAWRKVPFRDGLARVEQETEATHG